MTSWLVATYHLRLWGIEEADYGRLRNGNANDLLPTKRKDQRHR
jgi:hypothetical protein